MSAQGSHGAGQECGLSLPFAAVRGIQISDHDLHGQSHKTREDWSALPSSHANKEYQSQVPEALMAYLPSVRTRNSIQREKRWLKTTHCFSLCYP